MYFVLETVMGHFVFVTATTMKLYWHFNFDGTAEEKLELIISTSIRVIMYYYIFLGTIIIYNTVLLLRKDFMVFKGFLTSTMNIQEIELFPLYKPIENVSVSASVTKEETQKKLLEASKILNILFECVELCNGLFGLVILLMNFSTVLIILSSLNTLLIRGDLNQLNAEIVTTSILSFLIFLIWNSVITSACGLLKGETKSIINLCCKLQHLLPQSSKERQELLNLARQVSGKSPKISAAGFFDVDFSLIFSVFTYVGTYIVVLIQLSYIDF
ncbi:hypothetical protein JTB14_005512 [Gonioctena quinquepunctata]|nr:hypothetical protein JTB14_005512 [Gonioctena quinquepunctata]